MSKAYDEDVRNLQQKKPALKKIKVFTDVEKALKNVRKTNSFFLLNQNKY